LIAHSLLGDVTELPGLDDLHAPEGAIKEAQHLAARAFGADETFFIVNGSTCAIQSAILAVSGPGCKIAVSRDVHKAVIGGLILAGAYPVYIDVEVDKEFQIPLGPTPDSLKHVLDKHPDVRAVVFTNPNYYGISPRVDLLVALIHDYDKIAIIDEAHGAHLSFHDDLPLSGLEVGADLVISGAHKTLPAMTQASLLHRTGGRVPDEDISRALKVIETASPSYILMASLDIARKIAATKGHELLGRVIHAARKAQSRLNRSAGVRCLTEEDVVGKGFRHDPTKLVVSLDSIHMTGFEVARTLREKCRTEVEFADIVNIIAVLTMVDNEQEILAFADAIREIAITEDKRHERIIAEGCATSGKTCTKSDKRCEGRGIEPVLPDFSSVLEETPKQVMTPREAMFATWEQVELERAVGRVSADTVVAYPPGIILVCPGQEITGRMTDFMIHAASCGVQFHGVKDDCVLVVR